MVDAEGFVEVFYEVVVFFSVDASVVFVFL